MPAYDTVVFAVFVGFVAVAMFAVLNAVLVAHGLTRPVVDMTEVLRTVAAHRSARKIERLPQYQRDEIGVLVQVANEMLERLEQAEVERPRRPTSSS
jgi:HAMP domain-containing protein